MAKHKSVLFYSKTLSNTFEKCFAKTESVLKKSGSLLNLLGLFVENTFGRTLIISKMR